MKILENPEFQRRNIVARGLFLDYSTGIPLGLFARSQFQLQRSPAQFTVGRLLLQAVPAARANTFAAGQLTATGEGGLFLPGDAYTLPAGGVMGPVGFGRLRVAIAL